MKFIYILILTFFVTPFFTLASLPAEQQPPTNSFYTNIGDHYFLGDFVSQDSFLYYTNSKDFTVTTDSTYSLADNDYIIKKINNTGFDSFSIPANREEGYFSYRYVLDEAPPSSSATHSIIVVDIATSEEIVTPVSTEGSFFKHGVTSYAPLTQGFSNYVVVRWSKSGTTYTFETTVNGYDAPVQLVEYAGTNGFQIRFNFYNKGLQYIQEMRYSPTYSVTTPVDYDNLNFGVFSDVYQTQFTAVDFTYSSSTETLTVTTDYTIDIDEVDTSIPSKNPSMVRLRWSETAGVLPATNQSSVSDAIAVEDGSASITQYATNLPDGLYTFEVSFSNLPYQLSQDTNKKPFPRTYILFEVEIIDGLISASQIDEAYNGMVTEFGTERTECGITKIDGCIIRAIQFLIVPGEFSITAITTEFTGLLSKKPFSYFSQVTDVIQTASQTSASSTFVNLEIEFTTPPLTGTYPILTKDSLDAIYSTETRLMVRDIIAYGLWIIFALSLIFMLLNIFNRSDYNGGSEQSLDSQHTGGVFSYTRSGANKYNSHYNKRN